MKIFFKIYWQICLEIFIIFIISWLPVFWFPSHHVVIGLDSGYPLNYIQYFQQRLYTWLGSENFGIDLSAEAGVIPYNSFQAVVNFLGVPHDHVQQITFSLWFFAIAISMYMLIHYLYPQSKYWVIRFFAVFVYVFNLHLYSFFLQGEQPILASYVLLPLITLLLLRFSQRQLSILKTALYINFAYFFFSAGGIRGFLLIGPVFLVSGLIFLYFFYVNFREERFGYIKRYVFLIITFLGIFIFANAYLLLPFITSYQLQYANQIALTGSIQSLVDWTIFISRYSSLLNIFQLKGDNNWYDKPFLYMYPYLQNSFLIFANFLFPILAFSSSLFVKQSREKLIVLFFVLLALIAMFLSAGAHEPTGSLYIVLMKYIPGFNIFRSAYYKFIPAVYFSFAILGGITVYYLISKIPRGKIFIGIICLALIPLYNYPFFQPKNFIFNAPFTTMVQIPPYVQDFATMINKLPDNQRVLITPADGPYSIKTFTWGYWGSFPIFPLLTTRSFVNIDGFLFNEDETNLVNNLYADLRNHNYDNFKKAAEISNIKYVLLTKDVEKDYWLAPTENPDVYQKILDNKNMFSLIWSEGEWSLYEINTPLPTQKITAYNSITLATPPHQSIGDIINSGNIPFVFSDQITPQLQSTLPIENTFTSFSCISCIVREQKYNDIVLPAATILPNSPLYTLKTRNETKELTSAITPEAKIDALLGLSIKRTAEIVDYQDGDFFDKQNWVTTTNNLSSYWQQIFILLQQYNQNPNYDIFVKTHTYIGIELKALLKLYQNLPQSDQFALAIERSLGKIQQVDNLINPPLTKYDFFTTFIYDLSTKPSETSQVYLNTATLPKDINNQMLFPTSYTINNSTYPWKKDNTVITNIPPNAVTLRVNFDTIPNQLTNFREENINFPNRTLQCMTASLANYVADKTYLLSVTVNSVESPESVYIKYINSTLQTQDAIIPQDTFFHPDTGFGSGNFTNNTLLYQIKNRVNSSNIKLYFCTDMSTNPKTIYTNMSVQEIINPTIYTIVKNPIKQSSIPEMQFVKHNPASYMVHINAKDPYILAFLERFSPLWKLTREDNKPIHTTQFYINGYANGWYITDTGDYTLDITFASQKQFIIGVIITCITFIGMIVALVIIKIKKI